MISLLLSLLTIPTLPEYTNQEQNFQVNIEESTNLDESYILLDGKEISLTHQTVNILVRGEGKHILKYRIVDQDGHIDEDEIECVIDQSSPDIHVRCDDTEIDSNLIVRSNTNIKVNVEDENLKDKKLFIDGQLLEWNEDIKISPDMKLIKIECIDQAGNTSIKEIHVNSIEDKEPNINIDNNAYTTSKVEVSIDDSWNDIYDIVYLLDGKEVDQLCQSTGTYEIRIIPKVEYLKTYKYTFHYTNITPTLSCDIDIDYDSMTLRAQSIKNIDELEYESVRIFNGTYWMDSSTVPLIPNQDITYEVQAEIMDKFGQKAYFTKSIRVDLLAPKVNLYINQQVLNSGQTIHFNELPHIDYDFSEEVACQLNYLIDGQNVYYSSLGQAIQSMKQGQTLEVYFHLTDINGNAMTYVYTFVYDKTIELDQIKSDVLYAKGNIRSLFTQSQERTYELNEDSQIVVNQQINDIHAPNIQVIQRKNKIRIVCFNDYQGDGAYFIRIKINGKNKSLKKVKYDDLGNPYYEFSLKKKKTKISISASDVAGNSSKISKTLYLQKVNKKSLLQILSGWLMKLKYG